MSGGKVRRQASPFPHRLGRKQIPHRRSQKATDHSTNQRVPLQMKERGPKGKELISSQLSTRFSILGFWREAPVYFLTSHQLQHETAFRTYAPHS